MKKFISLCLVLVMALSMFAACGASKPALEGTPAEIIEKIYAERPMEISPVTLTPDDPDFGSMWDWAYHTGLENGDGIAAAAVSESMMGVIPYSLMILRVENAADAKGVAEKVKAGVDTRKWVCVEANDMQVAVYGDVVMMVMVGEDLASEGLTSQAFVDAFKTVCGAELDVVL